MLEQVQPGLYLSRGKQSPVLLPQVIGFDLDWTIVRTIRARFPKDANDWAFLPNRISILKAYQDKGYILAIFTNQGYTGAKSIMALNRINNIITALEQQGIVPWVFVATLHDVYRKPNIGMWNVLEQYYPGINTKESFYVGDAAGRPQDHSTDDIMFAQNVGISFFTPEQIFPNNQITIPDTQTMFIFVGMSGSGKTTYFEQNLAQRGWVHANQDTLKTADKVLRTVRDTLASGKSVAVDATNPTPDKRNEYIVLAAQYRVPTLIVYFVRNGYEWNKLRPKPVPDIAYNIYFKNLVEPTLELDRVPVVELF